MLNEIEKGQLAITTVQCFTTADGSLSDFPGLLKKVIRERVWERRSHHGRLIELPNLRALITEKPIQGWGQDPRKIEAVIKDDAEALAMYREAMVDEKHRHKKPDAYNVSIKPDSGNSRAYSLDRVKRECDPEVVAKVMSGKMKPHAALVAAGIRENRQIYIPKSMAEFAEKLYERLGKEKLEELIKEGKRLQNLRRG